MNLNRLSEEKDFKLLNKHNFKNSFIFFFNGVKTFVKKTAELTVFFLVRNEKRKN